MKLNKPKSKGFYSPIKQNLANKKSLFNLYRVSEKRESGEISKRRSSVVEISKKKSDKILKYIKRPSSQNLKYIQNCSNDNVSIQKVNDSINTNESPPLIIPRPLPNSHMIFYDEPRTNLDFFNNKHLTNSNLNNIKVVARFRPLNNVESDLLERNIGGVCVEYKSETSCVISNSIGFSQSFTFDKIFDSSTNQQKIFEESAKSTIDDILKGYNGTIFTYGQSGSGKTYTMYGPDLFDAEYKGIISRAIEYIFDYINNPINESIKFQIKFSMLEIYKECLYDLLDPENDVKELKIKETKDKQVYVKNLTEEFITNIDEFLLLIDQADKYRVVSETELNKQSSRSHLLFTIEVIQQLPDGSEKSGKLNLVDLAGSEKISKSNAQGETLEEAKKINLSLSTLGNVISNLSTNKDYIPYRDSKLTRILQDSLGGNYKTTLIVACSPHMLNSEETLSTLKFAMRAKKIKNKVKQNIKKSPEQLQAIISSLKRKLNKAKETIKILNAKLINVPKEIKDHYNLKEESIEKLNFSDDSASDISVLKANSYNITDISNYKRGSINTQSSFNIKSDEKIILEPCNLSFSYEKGDLKKSNKILNLKMKEYNNGNYDLLNISKVEHTEEETKEKHNDSFTKSSNNEIKKISVDNNQMSKTILNLENLIQQVKCEKDQIISQNIHLKEKCIYLQDKINENNINNKTSLVYDIEKVSNLLKEIENLSNKCYDSFFPLSNLQENLTINQLKKENLLLKQVNKDLEVKINNFVNNMMIYNNERKVNELINGDDDIITKEINNTDFPSKFDKINDPSIGNEDLINFFIEKENFFNNNLKETLKESDQQNLEKAKNNSIKVTLFKVFTLLTFYETLLSNKIMKEQIDQSLKSSLEEYNKKMGDYYSNYKQIFFKFQLLIIEFKKIKIEEILILQNSNKSVINQNLNERTNLITTKNINSIPNTIYKKNNLLYYDTHEKSLFKGEKTEDDFSVNESLKDEKANPSVHSELKNEQNEVLIIDKSHRKYTLNIPNRNVSNNLIKKEYVKKVHINKKESSKNINENVIISNESSDSEAQLHKEKKQKQKDNSNSPFNINIPFTRSNTLKNVTIFNKLKNPLKSSLLSRKILESPLLEEKNLNEIKQLKNEISMYKLYIQTINDKLEDDLPFKNKIDKAFEEYYSNTKLNYKSEVENLRKCNDLYQTFYEEELKTRNTTIEKLTSYIDSLKSMKPITSFNPTIYSYNFSANIVNNPKQLKPNFNQNPIYHYTSTNTNKDESSNISNEKQVKKSKAIRDYFMINKDLANCSDSDNKSLISIFNDESGSATKKFDYVKLGYNKENDLEIKYKNGLGCHTKGKSPLIRRFKISLTGDSCDDINSENLD